MEKKMSSPNWIYQSNANGLTLLCAMLSCSVMSDSRQRHNYILPGSSVHGILQARILEWVAISFSRGSSRPSDQTRSLALQADSLQTELWGQPLINYEVWSESRSAVSDSATPWTVALLAPLSMGFPRQEYGNKCYFLHQVIFPIQGSNLRLLHWQADSLPLEPPGKPKQLLLL